MPAEPADTIEELVGRLRAPDREVRERAAAALEAREGDLSVDEGIALLRAALDEYPPGQVQTVWADTPTFLIALAARKPRVEYVPVVESLFAGLPAAAREKALNLIATCSEREAAVAYVRLLRAHLPTGGITDLWRYAFLREPRHGDVLFPELLDHAGDARFGDEILGWALAYLDTEQMTPSDLQGHAPLLVSMYRDVVAPVRAAQRDEPGPWCWEEDYAEQRNQAARLLTLLSFLDDADAAHELRAALDIVDPDIRLCAAIALLRAGQEVKADILDAIASWAESRTALLTSLMEIGQIERFPERWGTQELLAESEMVRWLGFPTELGRPPDEIELMGVVTLPEQADAGDWYVFRFRTLPPHGAPEDGWRTGATGPYPRGQLTPCARGTFSKFRAADAMTPEQHVRAIVDRAPALNAR